MSDLRGVAWRIRIAFAVSAVAGIGFAVAYTVDAGTQALGLALAVACAGVSYGLAAWGRRFHRMGGYVEQRPPLLAPRPERNLLAETVEQQSGAPVGRGGFLTLLGLAVGAIGVGLLFPLRSLLPIHRPDPTLALKRTPWRGGRHLVTADGVRVRPADVSPETILTVFPDGDTKAGDAPAFVVRLDPARLRTPPPGGEVGGIVAYSLLCTHAGCPVALYEQGTGRMLCPCHQSAFDLRDGARPVAGPAARPLPGLPIEVDADGYLRSTGDFTGPPGPGFWTRP